MLEQIDRDTPKEQQLLAMKAADSRLAELGGGGYVGLAFKLKGLKACGFDDRGRPDPAQKFAAYQKAIAILIQLGDGATAESFIQAAAEQAA
jgi:hypothetical protein